MLVFYVAFSTTAKKPGKVDIFFPVFFFSLEWENGGIGLSRPGNLNSIAQNVSGFVYDIFRTGVDRTNRKIPDSLPAYVSVILVWQNWTGYRKHPSLSTVRRLLSKIFVRLKFRLFRF